VTSSTTGTSGRPHCAAAVRASRRQRSTFPVRSAVATERSARDAEFRRLFHDEVHLLPLRKCLRENDLEPGRRAQGGRSESRGNGRAVDLEGCGKRTSRRIADFDLVTVPLAQNEDDLSCVRSAEGDELAFATNAIDEETRNRTQGVNASFTRSMNERSSS
jgi:hypothetical protein